MPNMLLYMKHSHIAAETFMHVAFIAEFIETTNVPVMAGSRRILSGARAKTFLASAANRHGETRRLHRLNVLKRPVRWILYS
jgi:hypothetical protein